MTDDHVPRLTVPELTRALAPLRDVAQTPAVRSLDELLNQHIDQAGDPELDFFLDLKQRAKAALVELSDSKIPDAVREMLQYLAWTDPEGARQQLAWVEPHDECR